LPDFFGFTFTVQWVPDISDVQKAWQYFTMGISENVLIKGLVSTSVGVVYGLKIDQKIRKIFRVVRQ